MWDQGKDAQLRNLREADATGTLSDEERSDLQALTEERLRHDDALLKQATQHANRESRHIAARIEQAEAQNRELEALVREQETYLSQVQAMIAEMETRRREWRTRYSRITGRPLGDPVSAGSAH